MEAIAHLDQGQEMVVVDFESLRLDVADVAVLPPGSCTLRQRGEQSVGDELTEIVIERTPVERGEEGLDRIGDETLL